MRGWIGVVAQRQKLGLDREQAYARAWAVLTDANPFPATLGRVCPHPCESACNREGKDGAVAVKALERFLGDWGLQHELGLSRLTATSQPESIGVIGAGPAGLSFAYQMARRGYRVTVYEKGDRPGGMLYQGIPQFRLPRGVLDAEIRRILAVGVDLVPGTTIGRDVAVAELRARHAALFVGIGASRGRRLGIPGEDGAGCWTGTDYLAARACGKVLSLGDSVVVVGGGNTAIDAARCARRGGAGVTILYRRTPPDMPAIENEVSAALAEGVVIEYLAMPVRIDRRDGVVRAVVAQRTELGEVDGAGRRCCIPVEGSEFELRADTVIAAVSQQAEWAALDGLGLRGARPRPSADGALGEGVWAGGDALGPVFAGTAVAQGRRAAEALHARLRAVQRPPAARTPVARVDAIKADYYRANRRNSTRLVAADARLARPDAEVEETIAEETFRDEAARCFSCGLCFGCEHCFAYCNARAYTRLQPAQPGAYFSLATDRCEGCGQCIDVCPCGFLSRAGSTSADRGAAAMLSGDDLERQPREPQASEPGLGGCIATPAPERFPSR